MPITALPSHAVRAIGSTQVITDSASAVKELVDNAIDAGATAINIEISANALNTIVVRDNGHGIALLDRALVCKRYCTSKIKDLEDLARIGGSSLGFRGEALSSAAELSGGIAISTKIAGEVTAVSFKVSRDGEVENEERVSHPIGTTVKISELFKHIPVRRQTALKDASKQLHKIKRLLQAYALTRPRIRLSLKVLKAKNEKGNFMYAPKPGGSVSDAVVKILGNRVAEQCKWVEWDAEILASRENSGVTEIPRQACSLDQTYRIEAFIPRPECDLHLICNTGQFISVDSRPVSATRSTLKQIVSMFKSYLRSSCGSKPDEKILDPFLCINIVCPMGSYDANIEPSKDDVLFTNSGQVIEVVESFFRSIYGQLRQDDTSTARSRDPVLKPKGFELLLGKKPPSIDVSNGGTLGQETMSENNSLDAEERQLSTADPIAQLSTVLSTSDARAESTGHQEWVSHNEPSRDGFCDAARDPWSSSMYSDGEDNVLQPPPPDVNDVGSEDENDLRDIHTSNPWAMAKINSLNRSQQQPSSSISVNTQLSAPACQDGEPNHTSSSLPASNSNFSVQDFLTPIHCHPRAENPSSSPEPFPYPLKRHAKVPHNEVLTRRRSLSEEYSSSSAALDSWIQKEQPHRRANSQDHSTFAIDSTVSFQHPLDFVSARSLSAGTRLSAVPDTSQISAQTGPRRVSQKDSNINKSFVSPVNDPTKVWFDIEQSSSPNLTTGVARSISKKDTHADIRTYLPLRPETVNNAAGPIADDSPNLESTPFPSDLARTLDYETRKATAVAARRAQLRREAEEAMPFIKLSASQASSQSSLSQVPLAGKENRSSPHRNRYESAVAALRSGAASPFSFRNVDHVVVEGEEAAIANTTMSPLDPRSYLIRSSISSNSKFKTKRIKSSLLPLESIPSESTVVNLTLNLNAPSLVQLGAAVEKALKGDCIDAYIAHHFYSHHHDHDDGRTFPSGFETVNEVLAKKWEERVSALLAEKVGKGDVDIDVWTALRNMRNET